MKLRTTFHGNDLLFEGDLPLSLRALPTGAKVERAVITLSPVTPTEPIGAVRFKEQFPVKDGSGAFGIATQADATSSLLDLNARRTIQTIQFQKTITTPRLFTDLGGTWIQLDANGQLFPPATPGTPQAFQNAGTFTLPNLISQRLRIIYDAAPRGKAAPAITSVTLITYPTNLTLKLGDLGPFWFRLGDLREPVTTPDFATILQAFLDRNEPKDGAYDVPFILHSDALARLQLELDVDFHIEQSLLPPELNEATYPFQYAALPTAQPAPLQAMLPLNATVLPKATSAQVAGRFDGMRVIHGPVSATRVRDTLRVTPAQSAAHPIVLPSAATAGTIDVNLETVTSAARLLITLQEDVGGKPWGPSLLPAPIEVRTERPAAGGSTWVSAPLPADFTFHAGEAYWLIVNAVEGEVLWALEPAGDLPPLQVTHDAALSWRVHTSDALGGPVAGVYRLRAQLPGFRQPIKLDVAGHEVPLRKLDALGKVDFRLDLPEVAAAMNAALADAVLQQAASSERVANGDFLRWTQVKRKSGRVVVEPIGLVDNGTSVLLTSPLGKDVFALTHSIKDFRLSRLTDEAQPIVSATYPFNVAAPGTPGTLATFDPLSADAAISPDGHAVFLAAFAGMNQSDGDATFVINGLHVWTFHTTTGEYKLIGRGRAQSSQFTRLVIAADPNCRYVYLATMDDDIHTCPPFAGPAFVRLQVKSGATVDFGATSSDIDAKQEILLFNNEAGSFPGQPMALLVSPDGQRAYVVEAFNVHLVDPGDDTIKHLGRTRFMSPENEDGKSFVGAVLSPDGSRLFLLIRQPDPNTPDGKFQLMTELIIVDTSLLERVVAGALDPDDAILLRSRLDLIGPMDSTDPVSDPPFELPWFPTAVTPDGTRLVIADHLGSQVALVDAMTGEQTETIALPRRPVAIAVAPDSRRLFALTFVKGDSGPTVHAIELDAWTADAWALTGGRISPVSILSSAQPTARLGSPTDDTGLSQLVRVDAGQTYELAFRACASAAGATAELFWMNETCGLLGQQAIDIQQRQCGGQLMPHTLRAAAPAGVTVAEVRFRQPASDYTLLDDVSLRAPRSATGNGDFAEKSEVTGADGETKALPTGWQVNPDAKAIAFIDNGLILSAPAIGPSMLTQQVMLTPSRPFVLQVRAWPDGKPSANGNASIELRWHDSSESPIKRELAAYDFDVLTIQGMVPADADGTDVVITQPAEGRLRIESIALSQPQTAVVPLTFLSESPGQLSVIAPVVAFDVSGDPNPIPANAPLPQPIACKPTPPDEDPVPPNDGGGGGGYCPCCEGKHPLNDPDECVSETGMPCHCGTCVNCEADVTMYVS
jgi:DNA-binding beta-propeller fold protein YncE